MGAPERPPNQRVRLALLERGRLVVAVHFLAPVGRHSWHCDTNTTVSARWTGVWCVGASEPGNVPRVSHSLKTNATSNRGNLR